MSYNQTLLDKVRMCALILLAWVDCLNTLPVYIEVQLSFWRGSLLVGGYLVLIVTQVDSYFRHGTQVLAVMIVGMYMSFSNARNLENTCAMVERLVA